MGVAPSSQVAQGALDGAVPTAWGVATLSSQSFSIGLVVASEISALLSAPYPDSRRQPFRLGRISSCRGSWAGRSDHGEGLSGAGCLRDGAARHGIALALAFLEGRGVVATPQALVTVGFLGPRVEGLRPFRRVLVRYHGALGVAARSRAATHFAFQAVAEPTVVCAFRSCARTDV